MYTYIECDMAHDCRVVWQPDVLGIVLIVFALRGPRLLLVDNERALHIDPHISRVRDGLLDVALDRGTPGAPERGGRVYIVLRPRCGAAGFTRRGVVCSG
jgi:hypothetical protein